MGVGSNSIHADEKPLEMVKKPAVKITLT